jgi:hypothetical protein
MYRVNGRLRRCSSMHVLAWRWGWVERIDTRLGYRLYGEGFTSPHSERALLVI